MPYPSDPPNPTGANASTFVNPRLSTEEAERLAATFRPSWEVDDARAHAPETAPGGAREAPRGTATQADMVVAVRALNGTHAPVPTTVLDEPSSSVILDPSIVLDASPGAPGRSAARAAEPLVSPSQTPTRRRPRASRSEQATVPLQRARVAAVASDVFAKRSQVGLWVGLAAAAFILIGAGVWLASSSTERQAAPMPSAQRTQKAPRTSESPVVPRTPLTETPPPPRPSAVVPAASPPFVTPPPAATTVATATSSPLAAPPVPAPRPAVAPVAPRPPTWTPPPSAPAPAGRPVARPKGGSSTIVRDVPF